LLCASNARFFCCLPSWRRVKPFCLPPGVANIRGRVRLTNTSFAFRCHMDPAGTALHVVTYCCTSSSTRTCCMDFVRHKAISSCPLSSELQKLAQSAPSLFFALACALVSGAETYRTNQFHNARHTDAMQSIYICMRPCHKLVNRVWKSCEETWQVHGWHLVHYRTSTAVK
jgi:hypothetical protein